MRSRFGHGFVSFGDGIHGCACSPGFRNVIALKYQVGGGLAQSVARTNQQSDQPRAVLSGVTNPWSMTEGWTRRHRISTGARAEELRARDGRCCGDYRFALRATGAQVAELAAVPGFHPSFPGVPIPVSSVRS
jgi:hypothetical protein